MEYLECQSPCLSIWLWVCILLSICVSTLLYFSLYLLVCFYLLQSVICHFKDFSACMLICLCTCVSAFPTVYQPSVCIWNGVFQLPPSLVFARFFFFFSLSFPQTFTVISPLSSLLKFPFSLHFLEKFLYLTLALDHLLIASRHYPLPTSSSICRSFSCSLFSVPLHPLSLSLPYFTPLLPWLPPSCGLSYKQQHHGCLPFVVSAATLPAVHLSVCVHQRNKVAFNWIG